MTAPLTQPIPPKSGVLAFILAFVFGPLWFFYVGWRFGVSAIAYFMVYVAIFAIPWVGDWLAMAAPPTIWAVVHGAVVGMFAATVVDPRRCVLAGCDPTTFGKSEGTVFAIKLTLETYRAVQMTSFGLAGVIIAFRLARDGKVGAALLALFIALPIAFLFTGLIYRVCAYIFLFISALFNPLRGTVWINPGTFTMGSPSTEWHRFDDEGPQTRVTISPGFGMSKYETTQEEYLEVMGENPSYFTGDLKRPVEQVTWNDAANYCAKLTARERAAGRLPAGYEYRLPTEAEWEYACRAGTTTRFSFGDDLQYTNLGKYAWYDRNSMGQTHPVGVKAPNAWGLYDMHGSVFEWCLDWYGDYPGGSVTDPRGPSTGSHRVIRGGGWNHDGWNCRSTARSSDSPDSRCKKTGFRPVLAPSQPKDLTSRSKMLTMIRQKCSTVRFR